MNQQIQNANLNGEQLVNDIWAMPGATAPIGNGTMTVAPVNPTSGERNNTK